MAAEALRIRRIVEWLHTGKHRGARYAHLDDVLVVIIFFFVTFIMVLLLLDVLLLPSTRGFDVAWQHPGCASCRALRRSTIGACPTRRCP